MKIGLDLDDTVNYWMDVYLDRFGTPKDDQKITWDVENILKKDKQFWLNLPVKHRPDFNVTLFCTKRVNSKKWTKEWLQNNNISPKAPIYQMYYQKGNKAHMIKGKVDVFIDDSVSNMVQLNLSGVPCLLMDSPYNQSWGPVGRIYSLNKEEIIGTLELFKCTIFPYFKEFIKQ